MQLLGAKDNGDTSGSSEETDSGRTRFRGDPYFAEISGFVTLSLNRAISRRSSCTLWRNSSMMVPTVRFYTRGVRAVHKTEHLSAVLVPLLPLPQIRFRVFTRQ
jgi:hypothetical protein